MAPTRELETLNTVVDDHSHTPMESEFSRGFARRILQRSQTLKTKPPLVIRRFFDRVTGPQGDEGRQNKIARDFHGLDYKELTQKQRDAVDTLHGQLWNPAGSSEYLKPGLSFGEGYDLLLQAYRAENDKSYTQEIRAALNDFARALERDLEEAAKAGGFFDQFSRADKQLRQALAGPHRANQNIPIQAARR